MASMANNNLINILDEFYCPITQQLMVDPVIDPEGNSYEKVAIINWLQRNPISPLTRNSLSPSQLINNRALKNSIDKIRDKITQDQMTRQTPLAEKCSQEMLQILETSLDNIQLKMTYSEGKLHVKVMVPDTDTRAPAHVCLVIDISGSMGTEAKMKGSSGQVESHGFSLLDIVKQAAQAVRVTLSELDTLSIVAYSTDAKVVLQQTVMDSSGKAEAKTVIEQLKPEYQTNIWDGLHKALEICRLGKTDGRNDKIILLTDGQPNIIPPRGHEGMLQKYKDSHGNFPASIDTFGFGYHLDSADLNTISVASNGNYSFIPDSSMVGDLFSNSLGNFMATAVPNAQLSVELNNGIKLESVNGNHNFNPTTWGFQMDTGPLYYGQNKDFVFNLNVTEQNTGSSIDQSIEATCAYNHFSKVNRVSVNTLSEYTIDSQIQSIRLQFVETVHEALNQMRYGNTDVARTIVSTFLAHLQSVPFTSHPYIKSLIVDLSEQVTIALTKEDQFRKWGIHYLPSLARAHQQQVCNNFRDPGVQGYGGKLFKQMRDLADDRYSSLPAPKPSVQRYSGGSRGGYRGATRSAPSAPSTLASYNVHSGPCFSGDSLVRMSNGKTKRVDQVTKDDRVLVMSKDCDEVEADEIECVLKTRFNSKMTVLVELNGGWRGTPNHPIKHQGTWVHPKSIGVPKMMECDYVYSFLLKNRGTIIINDIESATFAHGLSDNDVIEHDYFGTERVVSDFKKMNGWNSGLIEITPDCIVRDYDTGFVVGINQLNKVSVA